MRLPLGNIDVSQTIQINLTALKDVHREVGINHLSNLRNLRLHSEQIADRSSALGVVSMCGSVVTM